MALDEYEFHKDPQKQSTFLELLNTISGWRDIENIFLFNWLVNYYIIIPNCSIPYLFIAIFNDVLYCGVR